MQAKNHIWILGLVLLAFFTVALPHRAAAAAVDTTTMCNDPSHDKNFMNNRTAYQQQALSTAEKVGNLFPIVPAMNQCVQNIMSVFAKVPSLSDPMGIAQAIIGPIIQNLISGVCSQVMNAITSVQNALVDMTKICLPIPQFDINLDLNFSGQSCSGGTQISPISGFSAPMNYPSYSQYLGH